jgi:hypothetical protein
VASPDGRGVAFEIPHRLAHGDVLRGTSTRLRFGVADPKEHAGTLGSGERQIEACNAGPTRRASQFAPVVGMRAAKNSSQDLGLDVVMKPELATC